MAKKKIDNSLLSAFNKTQTKKKIQIEQTKTKKAKELEEKRKQEELEKLQRQQQEEEQKRLEEQTRLKKLQEEIKNRNLTTYKIRLTTLSPVHIGDGEVYEPISYIIDNGYLYHFDEFLVLDKLIEENVNIDLKKLEDMATLVEFFKSHKKFIIDNELYISKVSVASDIAKLYDNDYGSSNNQDNSFNQMLILKNISTYNPKNSNFEPYIPGSSIKGALQTILSLSVEDSQKLKISDCIGVNVHNQIAWAVRNKIPQKLEIISKGSLFEFNISKSNQWSFEELKTKLNTHFKMADNKQFLAYEREMRLKNQFLLRVGRYVGQKFMSNNPEIKEPKTRTYFRKKEKDATSELPFGWVLCEIIN